MSHRLSEGRSPAVATDHMVATSQGVATRAGLRALERGGNAVDAAVAAAAALCVAEPMSTGVGGDLFAIVWSGGKAIGVDAAGPAPGAADPAAPTESRGPRSVTVPGAVAGWQALSERFGRLGLDSALDDAIELAERGVGVSPRVARAWAGTGHVAGLPAPPRVGQRVRFPALAGTLRAIADRGAEAIYGGRIAEAIAAASWLEPSDLAGFRARFVEPLVITYRGRTVLELPPPTQGVAALEALALLDGLEPSLANQALCARLALEDALEHVRDGAEVRQLLDPTWLAQRRGERPDPVREPPGGTVYLCAVDGDGMAVSLVQSLFDDFGSRVVAEGTGIVLQNRGAGFAVGGAVVPGRRPYHTIIPGLLTSGGELLGPFGVMGGYLQAQAHVQLVSALVDDGLDPQAALDEPRFRLEGSAIRLEPGLWDHASELERALDLRPIRDEDPSAFGGGQAIIVQGDVLLGGSDPRKDGCALGR